MSVIHCALLCCQCQLSVLCTIAKFHCTDTDTDPNGPARSQRSFAAKSPSPCPCPCPCRARVRVRVVEFSSYCPTLCSDVRPIEAEWRTLRRWNLSGENKKLSYRRVTARCVLSVAILPITTLQCRNYSYDKSWPNRWYEVGGLVGGNVS